MQDLHIKNMSEWTEKCVQECWQYLKPAKISVQKSERNFSIGKNLVSLASLDCYLTSGFTIDLCLHSFNLIASPPWGEAWSLEQRDDALGMGWDGMVGIPWKDFFTILYGNPFFHSWLLLAPTKASRVQKILTQGQKWVSSLGS